MKLIFSDNFNVTMSYKFFLKNSRKYLTKNHYFFKKKCLKREQNTHLMFVRAPKHFKSGKQIIVFFNGVYKTFISIKLKNSSNIIHSLSNKSLYSFFKNFCNKKLINDIILSKITISSSFTVSFNGRNYFFTTNN